MNFNSGLVLVVGIGVVALVVLDRVHNDAELARLRSQVANLPHGGANDGASRTELRMVSGPGWSETPAPPASAARADVAKIAPEPSGEAARGPTTPGETRDAYEIAFGEDHGDVSWTAKAMHEATARLSAALPEGSTVRSFECRTSMCRIETSHTDRARYRKFAKAAFMNPGTRLWNGAVFSTTLEDDPGPDSLVTVAYLARDGHDLPSLE
jgi:hypothetical protein